MQPSEFDDLARAVAKIRGESVASCRDRLSDLSDERLGELQQLLNATRRKTDELMLDTMPDTEVTE